MPAAGRAALRRRRRGGRGGEAARRDLGERGGGRSWLAWAAGRWEPPPASLRGGHDTHTHTRRRLLSGPRVSAPMPSPAGASRAGDLSRWMGQGCGAPAALPAGAAVSAGVLRSGSTPAMSGQLPGREPSWACLGAIPPFPLPAAEEGLPRLPVVGSRN